MTFKILENIPEDFLSEIKKSVLNCNLDDREKYRYIVGDEYQDYIFPPKDHELYDILGKYFKNDFRVVILKNNPNCGLGPVHTDGSRFGCINFPIKVDLDNSSFFIEREGETPTIRPPHPDEPINNNALRFLYEPEKYLYYNLRKAICISTKSAHGAFNHSNEERILLSVAFPGLESYEDILDQVPEKWL